MKRTVLLAILICLIVGSVSGQGIPAFFYPLDGAYVNAVGDSLIFYERTDGTDSIIAIFSQNGIYWMNSTADSALMIKADLDATYEVQLNDEAGLYAVLSDVSDFVQPGDAAHDGFSDFVANEHIDWTQTGAGTIHVDNLDTAATVANGSAQIVTGNAIYDWVIG
jgi:hypothetical protein